MPALWTIARLKNRNWKSETSSPCAPTQKLVSELSFLLLGYLAGNLARILRDLCAPARQRPSKFKKTIGAFSVRNLVTQNVFVCQLRSAEVRL